MSVQFGDLSLEERNVGRKLFEDEPMVGAQIARERLFECRKVLAEIWTAASANGERPLDLGRESG